MIDDFYILIISVNLTQMKEEKAMAEQKTKAEIRLDVLIKKEKDYYSAHCLQFDLVATDDSLEGVQKAIKDLCIAHVEESIRNNNLEYLFSPAPKEFWTEYFSSGETGSCKIHQESMKGMDKIFNIQEVLCYA